MWTVVGQDPVLINSSQLAYTNGMGVALSNGMWMSSSEGIVTLSKDGVGAIEASGHVELRSGTGSDEKKLYAKNMRLRETEDGRIEVVAQW